MKRSACKRRVKALSRFVCLRRTNSRSLLGLHLGRRGRNGIGSRSRSSGIGSRSGGSSSLSYIDDYIHQHRFTSTTTGARNRGNSPAGAGASAGAAAAAVSVAVASVAAVVVAAAAGVAAAASALAAFFSLRFLKAAFSLPFRLSKAPNAASKKFVSASNPASAIHPAPETRVSDLAIAKTRSRWRWRWQPAMSRVGSSCRWLLCRPVARIDQLDRSKKQQSRHRKLDQLTNARHVVCGIDT